MRNAFQVLLDAAPAFRHGLANTLSVWLIACSVGTFVGALFGTLLYMLRNKSRLYLAAAHVLPTLARSVPILVLLVWVHYSLPEYGISISRFATSSIVLTLSVAVAAMEVTRGALESIPVGEVEGAFALGLHTSVVSRRILLPLGMRTAMPGLLLLYVDTLKLTTFTSVIAFEDLLHVTDTTITNTYRAMPAYTALAMIFITMVFPFEYFARAFARSRSIIR
jgi:polar amino acid transport system permease protein